MHSLERRNIKYAVSTHRQQGNCHPTVVGLMILTLRKRPTPASWTHLLAKILGGQPHLLVHLVLRVGLNGGWRGGHRARPSGGERSKPLSGHELGNFLGKRKLRQNAEVGHLAELVDIGKDDSVPLGS